MTYILGLDVGKQHDYTALTIVEPYSPALHIVHLHRYPLGTNYTVIADDLAQTLAKPPLAGASILGVDATGLGGPFLDLLRERVVQTPVAHAPALTGSEAARQQLLQTPVIGITITGQRSAKWRSRTDVLVPKAELVRTLARLVEQRQIRMAQGLALAPLLAQEMQRFQVSIDRNGRAHYAADVAADTNDDLVLSAMYACWLAVTLRV